MFVCSVCSLEHHYTFLLIHILSGTVLHILADLFDSSVFQHALGSHTYSVRCFQPEAARQIIGIKLIFQAIVAINGLLMMTAGGTNITHLIVKILISTESLW